MKVFKKLILLLTAVMLVFTMFACSSASDAETDGSNMALSYYNDGDYVYYYAEVDDTALDGIQSGLADYMKSVFDALNMKKQENGVYMLKMPAGSAAAQKLFDADKQQYDSQKEWNFYWYDYTITRTNPFYVLVCGKDGILDTAIKGSAGGGTGGGLPVSSFTDFSSEKIQSIKTAFYMYADLYGKIGEQDYNYWSNTLGSTGEKATYTLKVYNSVGFYITFLSIGIIIMLIIIMATANSKKEPVLTEIKPLRRERVTVYINPYTGTVIRKKTSSGGNKDENRKKLDDIFGVSSDDETPDDAKKKLDDIFDGNYDNDKKSR